MIHRTTKKPEQLMRKEPLLPMKKDYSKGLKSMMMSIG